MNKTIENDTKNSWKSVRKEYEHITDNYYDFRAMTKLVEMITEKYGDHLFASTSIGRLVISPESRYDSKCDKIIISYNPNKRNFSFSYFNEKNANLSEKYIIYRDAQTLLTNIIQELDKLAAINK